MKKALVIMIVLSFHLPVSPESLITQKVCVGEKAELPCNFKVAKDFMDMVLMYIQKEVVGRDEVVYEYSYGKEINTSQNEKYKNRSVKVLNNFTVHLKDITTEDRGRYKCIILQKTDSGLTMIHTSTIDLEVYALYSEPQVLMEPNAGIQYGDFVNLTCNSKGGYPQADILWTVISGNVTLKVIHRTKTVPYGKNNTSYYLNSTAMIHVTEDAVITCSVEHSALYEIKTSVNYSLHVSPPLTSHPSPTVWIAVLFLIILLSVLPVIWFMRKKQCSKKSYHFPVTRRNKQPVKITADVGEETAEKLEGAENNYIAEYVELEMPLKMDT
ncbi:T-lymphocyte activation antigen CD86-like [Protopterus annectens]|uniref:T-lymphocyte activation antigen CD86-like n=1 Tax=Protopterus annectens TaxID=7888 RepID=UPI001CFAB331|nr:T-lymphocyte activation antigen CD86-like [Protopterus annectens]